MENSVAIEKMREDIKSMKTDVRVIIEYIEEGRLEISDEAKTQIKESRKRNPSEFVSQQEIERRFL